MNKVHTLKELAKTISSHNSAGNGFACWNEEDFELAEKLLNRMLELGMVPTTVKLEEKYVWVESNEPQLYPGRGRDEIKQVSVTYYEWED